MTKRTTPYILRYGESRENDLVAYFHDEETILENLVRIIPTATQRGRLPQGCSPENVKLSYGKTLLNLNLPLKEQVLDAKPRDVLTLRDLASTVKLTVRYRPDHFEEQSEPLLVNPNKPLGAQLSEFFEKISNDHTFYRRKPKKYRVKCGDKRLNLGNSLVAQGYDSGVTVKAEPRVGLLRWPPPLAAVIAISIVLVAALIFVAYKAYDALRSPSAFRVAFVADAECHVVLDGETRLSLGPDRRGHTMLEPGVYSYEVRPQDYPMFRSSVTVDRKLAESDSIVHQLAVASRFQDAGKIRLTISGYQGHDIQNQIKSGLTINGYPREFNTIGYTLVTVVPKGKYEIKFDISDELFNKKGLQLTSDILHPDQFVFDFSHVMEDEVVVSLPYRFEEEAQ